MRCRITPILLCASIVQTCLAVRPAPTTEVLVEAESFENLGGWVVDQQFMDQMGSPFVLAHGLGIPVADATTNVVFPEPGAYRVWVRTRDWVAQWKVPGPPGRFQISVAGKKLAATFGVKNAHWHWQDGGKVDIRDLSVTLALHDLTGFEGRCDAILFTKDLEFKPPNSDPAMTAGSTIWLWSAAGSPGRAHRSTRPGAA